MSIITFDNVGVRYTIEKEILSNINISINQGDFVFVSGKSGAGKTTLLKMLHGSLKPTRGNLHILGKNIIHSNSDATAAIRQQIGFVFQDFKLIPQLTVAENIALPLKVINENPKKIAKIVDEMLNWIDLYPQRNMYPQSLSGGQQQKVAVSRAVITKPKIILADEPTGSIDEYMSDKIISMFKELNDRGVTIVFSTHDTQLLQNTSYRILSVSNGNVTYTR